MKKSKEESPLKAARKKATKSIQIRLAKLLKTITSELGQNDQKPAIDIEKESKKLAKKIAKHLVNKDAEKGKTAIGNVEKQKKEIKGTKEGSVEVLPVAKADKPAVAAATVKNNAPKAKAIKVPAPNPDKK